MSDHSDFRRFQNQLNQARVNNQVRQNIPQEHGKPASKKTCKDLLQAYVDKRVTFTPVQFKSILDRLCKKKDGTISEYTQNLLSPLYQSLSSNQLPPHAIVLVILNKLNKPFFRRGPSEPKRDKEEEKKEENKNVTQTKTKSSSFIETKDPLREEKRLKAKLHEEWKKKNADAWRANDVTDKIKSVGNGL